MIAYRRNNARAFSLIELVIVVVIIGIISAIAIPRMSRGSKGAAENALRGDLAVMRGAIELYAAEHDGDFPTLLGIVAQLETYTNFSGGTNAVKTAAFEFGPYIHAIPTAPVGPSKGTSAISGSAGPGVAWVYTASTGDIVVYGGTATDSKGVLFNTY